jgi:hypothetical protein
MNRDDHSFRTILVVGYQNDWGNALIRNLALESYLVLTARDGAEAIEIARTHSRPIHLLMVEKTDPALFTELQPYQPGIRILIVEPSPETALARVRGLFGSLKEGAACV